jgi:hypothetical protein
MAYVRHGSKTPRILYTMTVQYWALKMEAVRSSETLITTYKTARRRNREIHDYNLQFITE